MTSIIAQLGYGSGLDTQTLVAQLTAAAREPKDKLIATREAKTTASVSSLATVSNGIDAFSTSLKTLIAGGTLMTQPTASDDSIVGVRALTGARIGDLSAQLEVRQLAQAQSLSSAVMPSRTASVGTGTLTLTVGTTAVPIQIGSANNSVAGLAAAINNAKAGVTATVIDDAGGVRLVLKGGTGAAKAFTLSAAADPDPVDGNGDPAPPAVALGSFAYDPGQPTNPLTRAQTAQDAVVKLDGVELSRATNSFSDAIPGVIVDLKKAAIGTTINIGALRPADAITSAIGDFVGAYNEMKGLIDAATKPADADGQNGGPLRGDIGLREMQRRLAKLTATPLVGGGTGPKTLSEIGVVTNRDGTLTLDSARLTATLAANPDAVEALFNPGQRSDNPFVTVTNSFGAAKPGTYRLTDLVPPNGSTIASGKVDGADMLGDTTSLVAPVGSAAAGLIIRTSAPVASATITVDLGIGGALQSIRDALRASSGPLAATSARLGKEATQESTDRASLEKRSTTYNSQLTAQFTAMEKRVSAFKATQSYIEQQVALWTKSS